MHLLDARAGHLYRNAQDSEYERFIVATVLAYTTPAMGHLFPISVLLSELRGRGHGIALRTLTAGVETGRQLGVATAAVDPRIEAILLDDADAPNPKVALQQALSAFARHAEYEVRDLAAALDETCGSAPPGSTPRSPPRRWRG